MDAGFQLWPKNGLTKVCLYKEEVQMTFEDISLSLYIYNIPKLKCLIMSSMEEFHLFFA